MVSILHSHKLHPIDRIILLATGQLLHVQVLLPSILKHLIPHITLHFIPLIPNLLMDVTITIMVDHIDVQSILSILIVNSKVTEMLLFLFVWIILPIG